MKRAMILLMFALAFAGDGINDFKNDAGSTIANDDRIHFLDVSTIGTAKGQEYITYLTLYSKIYADLILAQDSISAEYASLDTIVSDTISTGSIKADELYCKDIYQNVGFAGLVNNTTSVTITEANELKAIPGTFINYLHGFELGNVGIEYMGSDTMDFVLIQVTHIKSSAPNTVIYCGSMLSNGDTLNYQLDDVKAPTAGQDYVNVFMGSPSVPPHYEITLIC